MFFFRRVLFEFNLSCLFITDFFLFLSWLCFFLKNQTVCFGFVFRLFGALFFCVQT